jgi:hypothetical protein
MRGTCQRGKSHKEQFLFYIDGHRQSDTKPLKSPDWVLQLMAGTFMLFWMFTGFASSYDLLVLLFCSWKEE